MLFEGLLLDNVEHSTKKKNLFLNLIPYLFWDVQSFAAHHWSSFNISAQAIIRNARKASPISINRLEREGNHIVENCIWY
jgi:hypothetical protein